MIVCIKCRISKPIAEFYKGRNKCKVCYQARVHSRKKANKETLVKYLGGKCTICGYNACIAALEFHHKIPKQKCFGVAENLGKSLKALKVEVDKCILLCSNCHKEIEYGYSTNS